MELSSEDRSALVERLSEALTSKLSVGSEPGPAPLEVQRSNAFALARMMLMDVREDLARQGIPADERFDQAMDLLRLGDDGS